MWLLEHEGTAFGGNTIWLRPGKRYLFGRTASAPGEYAIQDKTISRKHLTITIDPVVSGDGNLPRRRSQVTLEDLGTKIGTWVDGVSIKGAKHVLTRDTAEIKMGLSPQLFQLRWQPIVFTFSLSSKQLIGNPWGELRPQLEQLDIKFIADYNIEATTHVVTKKRNTAKSLQALINGKYVVSDDFVQAVVSAAAEEDSNGTNLLERNFYHQWPDAMQYLPPRGDPPPREEMHQGEAPKEERPDRLYSPDKRRADIFDGYTFIFYDRKQYDNLSSAIANGNGKVLFTEVIAHKSDVDDFIQYVKGVAGEQGLGEFEDGSEGRGVVVIRYVPPKGDDIGWYTDFFKAYATRLDHRPIEQREFLDAILDVNAAILRRPLEMESVEAPDAGEVLHATTDPARREAAENMEPSQAATRRRVRKVPVSRFKGFVADISDDADEPGPSEMTADGRMKRQRPDSSPPPPAEDLMEDIAPTAAAIKRRRLETGEDPFETAATAPANDADEVVAESPPFKRQPPKAKAAAKGRGVGKKMASDTEDILDRAIHQRQEVEAQARAEQQRLEHGADDEIDYEEIRRMTIVETMDVRQPQAQRTREQDIADGRWDATWNGRKNFKRFKKQGDANSRPLQRVVVSLEPVKAKEYGIGDDYWLESTEVQERHRRKERQSGTQGQTQFDASMMQSNEGASERRRRRVEATIGSETSDDEILDDDESLLDNTVATSGLSRTKKGKAADVAIRSQSVAQTQDSPGVRGSGKRPADSPAGSLGGGSKKRPATRTTMALADSDSDDGLKFRFGRRR